MLWILFAFVSAALLGFYDVCKKQALKSNAVIPVLTLNTLFSSIVFLPIIWLSHNGQIAENSIFYCTDFNWWEQKYILLKACIVLASWLLAYFGIKHLPLTIVGPNNNIKITTREDLPGMDIRIGSGFDVHKLVEGQVDILHHTE